MKSELPIILAVILSLVAIYGLRPSRAGSGWLSSSKIFPVVWVLIFLLPYMAFGPSSYLWMDDEGDLLVPFHYYVANFADGGQYSHLLGAGADLKGSFLIGGELISPERFLMAHFPLWIAIAVHKALTCVFGFAGNYLLARRLGGLDRRPSLALAAFGTVFWFRMILVTYSTGMTLSLIPIGVYLLVGRLGRRWWWGGALAYAVMAGLWMVPTEGAPAISIAVVATMILTKRYDWRPFAGIALAGIVIGVNWSESIYAMLQTMGESMRGSDQSSVSTEALDVIHGTIVGYLSMFTNTAWPLGLEIALSLAFLAIAAPRQVPRALITMILPVFFIAGFLLFPWTEIGLAGIRNSGTRYFTFGVTGTVTLVAAQAIIAWKRRGYGLVPWVIGRGESLPAALALVGAFAILGWNVGFQMINLFYRSGQAHYHVSNLKNPTWFNASDPARVVSLRASYLQPEPGVVLAYNLPYFDAWLNLMDPRFFRYWVNGVNPRDPTDPRIGYDWASVRGGVVHVEEMVSLPLLAAANVGYLVSALPVTGQGLVLLDGPDRPQLEKPSRSGVSPMEYYRDRWSRIFDLGKMHIYALPGRLPRVWAAAALQTTSSAAGSAGFLAEVAAAAPARVAVLNAAHAMALGKAEAHASMTVGRFDLVRNGFEVDLDAPEGGVLMVNALATRHFRAWADGRELPFTEANGVQTAIAVPAGSRHVSLCYGRRPLVATTAKDPRECGLAAARSP
ncbi:hypothetical protein [Paramagnetospirillum magneticum]|uniref:Uncharacterized protein n=1 Tax=Paramagnetospirillum magneticum (strain ATCC 700264 / AMB-1) TaxID=342108 RepID=Q2WB28_PARM1|nr:hypothetical protein [Paramagnetospirillum magneticum]BAE48947.1 hypothetical protein amb0143 [Paramagnetospirillum magneticum AMB-1]